MVFTIWNHLSLRKHLKNFKNNYRHQSSLTDEKYFELKSKQEYIIATSAIIFALLSFVGISSIKELKAEIETQVQAERRKINSIDSTAEKTHKNLAGLQLSGKDLKDSIRSAMNLVEVLKSRVISISNKDVIKQNIFIIDPLKMGDFPHSNEKYFEEFRIIKFKDLLTVNGQQLPIFKVAPSIVCFSTSFSSLIVKDVTAEGFKIKPDNFLVSSSEKSKSIIDGDEIKFSVWISQKSSGKEFSDDFSDDFKKK